MVEIVLFHHLRGLSDGVLAFAQVLRDAGQLEIAEIGRIASRPSTPVLATALRRVPLYDVPIIPTLPVET